MHGISKEASMRISDSILEYIQNRMKRITVLLSEPTVLFMKFPARNKYMFIGEIIPQMLSEGLRPLWIASQGYTLLCPSVLGFSIICVERFACRI